MSIELLIGAAIALFLGGGWLGWRNARQGMGGVVIILLLLMLVVNAYLLIKAQTGQGWDGLGYFLFWVFLAAPPLAGLVPGAIFGWLRRRRALNDAEKEE